MNPHLQDPIINGGCLMIHSPWSKRALAWLAVILLNGFFSVALAAEIQVVSSGGFAAAYRTLAPQFEAETGHKLISEWGPSMGDTPEVIPNRLNRGEDIDVVIMVGKALDELVREGKVLPIDHVVLALSKIGMAVKTGSPKPDISTMEAFNQTLLAARSVAYSDSASGVYIANVVFPRLGIVEQMRTRARMIPGEPVGRVVARGEAEIGFQQISELLAVPGVDLVGPLPPEVQQITRYAVGIVSCSKEQEAADP